MIASCMVLDRQISRGLSLDGQPRRLAESIWQLTTGNEAPRFRAEHGDALGNVLRRNVGTGCPGRSVIAKLDCRF